jgi:enoyl-CoA hydratase
MNPDPAYETVRVERAGPVLIMGLARPHKRNAFDLKMMSELAAAYGLLEADDALRVGVLYGEGPHFTAGLDLASVAPELQGEFRWVPEGGINPWQVDGHQMSKPVVGAAHGRCLTLGIELLLATDIVVAAASATFQQLEIARGIFPFGGATLRFPAAVGWGNAMRWMLTAEEFDAREAHRIGVVQEIVADGGHLDYAVGVAQVIARQAPLGVQATLRSARRAQRDGHAVAEADLLPTARRLFASEDARRGFESFLSRTPAEFVGR